jgi:outer membrane protein OmpA-like peptidoglycan-associated protein
MDIIYFRMNKARRRTITGALCFVLLVLVHTVFPSSSYGADTDITVFWIETDTVTKENYRTKPLKDYYINGGEDDGFSESMILDVYRKKFVKDSSSKREFEISIMVGQVKVLRLAKKIAVTRIIALTSSDDTPVMRYRTVMLGDYVVPAGAKIDIMTSRTIETVPQSIPLVSPAVSIPSKVLFEYGKSELKPEAKEVLSVVYDTFNNSRDKNILIEGHTCSLGTDQDNLELSQKRTQSVSNYLANIIGIPINHIRISYYGEKYPVYSNSTEEGRSKNRRVAIRFLPREEKIASK